MKRPKAKPSCRRPTCFSDGEWAELSWLSAPLIQRLASNREAVTAAKTRKLTKAARTTDFHLLGGVWQDGAFSDAIWTQIRKQLETAGDLNRSERAVLIELLKRMGELPRARKAIGFRSRSRVAQRNDDIAEHYVYLTKARNQLGKVAELETRKHFPTVGASTISKVIENRALMASARMRVIARIHITENTPRK